MSGTSNTTNKYGTIDGKPANRNINRADQRIINEFHQTTPDSNVRKQINNNFMFTVMDAAVYEGHNRNIFERIMAFSPTSKMDICQDAVETLIEERKIQPNMEKIASSGCTGVLLRRDGNEVINQYMEDRKEIIERKHPVITIGKNF